MAKYKEKSGNMSYSVKGMKGDFGHASKPMPCDPFKAQKADMGRLKEIPRNNEGYPQQAWAYKY